MQERTTSGENDQPLYHGTAYPFTAGDVILPANTVNVARLWAFTHDGSDAFATEDLQSAKFFAATAGVSAATAGMICAPHFVYQVVPVDPADVRVRDLQEEADRPPVIEHHSRAGFRVVTMVWQGAAQERTLTT